MNMKFHVVVLSLGAVGLVALYSCPVREKTDTLTLSGVVAGSAIQYHVSRERDNELCLDMRLDPSESRDWERLDDQYHSKTIISGPGDIVENPHNVVNVCLDTGSTTLPSLRPGSKLEVEISDGLKITGYVPSRGIYTLTSPVRGQLLMYTSKLE